MSGLGVTNDSCHWGGFLVILMGRLWDQMPSHAPVWWDTLQGYLVSEADLLFGFFADCIMVCINYCIFCHIFGFWSFYSPHLEYLFVFCSPYLFPFPSICQILYESWSNLMITAFTKHEHLIIYNYNITFFYYKKDSNLKCIMYQTLNDRDYQFL